jgi:hypothetical protein
MVNRLATCERESLRSITMPGNLIVVQIAPFGCPTDRVNPALMSSGKFFIATGMAASTERKHAPVLSSPGSINLDHSPHQVRATSRMSVYRLGT